MKKIFAAVLVLLALAGLCACGKTAEPVTEPLTQPESEPGYEGMANPWQDCSAIEDAVEIAGFNIAVPDRIEGYPETVIQAMDKKMIQVFYCNASFDYDNAKTVLIRKGTGSEDISGDYNEYPETKTQTMHGVEVTLKGSNGLVNNAVWYQGGFAYSISADDGMSAEQIESLVELIK
ncbi:MAG: hypothetical protein IJ050_03720 [Clostridia bacterium]|nr:hypothetical protein [Clostridia bacterium]